MEEKGQLFKAKAREGAPELGPLITFYVLGMGGGTLQSTLFRAQTKLLAALTVAVRPDKINNYLLPL